MSPHRQIEALSTPNQGGGVLTREVIGQSCLGVVSLVNSSILSNEVKDTILEEQEEEIINDPNGL